MLIRNLLPSDNVKAFDCGNHGLNDFLRRYALPNADKGMGVCRVLVHDSDVLGYYVLSAAEVAPAELPAEYPYRLPRYGVPCVRLARLAIHRAQQRQGLGGALLVDACRQIVRAAAFTGVHAVVVDALDVEAAAYYQGFGFVQLHGKPLTLVVPLASLAKEFGL